MHPRSMHPRACIPEHASQIMHPRSMHPRACIPDHASQSMHPRACIPEQPSQSMQIMHAPGWNVKYQVLTMRPCLDLVQSAQSMHSRSCWFRLLQRESKSLCSYTSRINLSGKRVFRHTPSAYNHIHCTETLLYQSCTASATITYENVCCNQVFQESPVDTASAHFGLWHNRQLTEAMSISTEVSS